MKHNIAIERNAPCRALISKPSSDAVHHVVLLSLLFENLGLQQFANSKGPSCHRCCCPYRFIMVNISAGGEGGGRTALRFGSRVSTLEIKAGGVECNLN